MCTYKTNKALGRGIRNTLEPYTTDTLAILITGFVFNSNYYKCLVLRPTTTFARTFATYIGFINFYSPMQPISLR